MHWKGIVENMNFLKKWYTYQKERFPVLIYGLYVFAIAFAVFCYCNHYFSIEYIRIFNNTENYLIGASAPYNKEWILLLPMFIVALLQFLMVRIVDEFKDYEEDCKFRAYRPVPRGLISLKELKILFIICAILQIIITYFVSPIAILYLIILWIFFAIMSNGFFVKKFIEKHILVEVALDELMMPVLTLYLSRFVRFINPIHSFYSYIDIKNIWRLLLMSYIISCIVEIARKVRCREDEEVGVKTYTAVFGIKKAILILFVLETLLMMINNLILKCPFYIGFVIYTIVALINLIFVIKQNKVFSKLVELAANIYVLIAYVSMVLLIL